MQSVTVEIPFEEAVHCPFCGEKIITPQGCNPCEHTLFIAANQGGFEFLDSEKMKFDKDVEMLDSDGLELDLDEFLMLKETSYPNSFMMQIENPSPMATVVGYLGLANPV